MRPVHCYLLPLLFLAACSQGGRTTDDPLDLGLGTDAARQADLSSPADLRPKEAGYLEPSWVWSLQGGTTLWGPTMAAMPRQGESGPARMVGGFVTGSNVPRIVVGAGDPGQTEIVGILKPVALWVDGQNGRVMDVRQIAADPVALTGVATLGGGVVVNAEGVATFGGEFGGDVLFLPNSGLATNQSTQRHIDSSAAVAAEDPYLVRYKANGEPVVFARGRTPGPISKNWYNYCEGLAPLSDGSMLLVGAFEDAGLVVGDGTTGATTLGGSGGTYLARLDSQGVPTWIKRNDGQLSFSRNVRPGNDGTAYMLAQYGAPATLLVDSAQPVPLTVPAGHRGVAVIKLSSSGTIAWVRRIISDGYSFATLGVSAEGRVVVAGGFKGKLDLLADGDRLDATQSATEDQSFVASWGPDGTFGWLTALGPGVQDYNALTVASSGEVWLAAQALTTVRSLPLDGGGQVLLPEVTTADAFFTLLYHLSPAGKRTRIDLLGVNLPINQFTSDADGNLGIAGGYGDWATDVRVGAPGGGSRNMPLSEPGKDQRLYFMSVRP